MKTTLYTQFLTKQELILPFYVSSLGNPKFQPEVYRPKGICDCQLLYTKSGSGECIIDGETHLLTAGTVLFSPRLSPHQYKPIDSNWETLFLTFGGSGLSDFFNYKCGIFKLVESFQYEARLNELFELKRSNRHSLLSVKLYELLIELNDIFHASRKNILKNKEKIDTALSIIRDDPCLTVPEIAEALGICEEYFCRIFKSYMGYRPLEYINILKLQKAKMLLSDESLSIKGVAESSGFNDHSYFGKLFKNTFGLTPSEYRRTELGISV